MMRLGMVGLGKMGLSHLAIARAHPDVSLAAACDKTAYLTEVLTKYTGLKCHDDFERMLDEEPLDAVLIATPSKSHAAMVRNALERGLHVFCEKPFVLDATQGESLVGLAESKGLVNQVGYHYRFVGAFQEAARIARSGALGRIHHVRAEAYGPVVLRTKGGTWRSARNEGGGALYDYACHALDLVNFIVGMPDSVAGVVLGHVFSRDVEDEVYCTFNYRDGASGQLCVNWSDESQRKMSTRITVWGSNGRVCADRQECQVYLRTPHASLPKSGAGWSVRYTTDLTKEAWFYLRGEEYSAQIDHFVKAVQARTTDNVNSFRSALQADRLVQMILDASQDSAAPVATRTKGFWARYFG
jgi:scyllo-inositol 2-dehydrogenase (NADP+)